MNQRDKENLNFLLNASPETLKDWYESVEEDDHIYAQELLESYRQELAETEDQKYEFEMEKELMKMSNFPEVDAILSKCKYLH